MQDVGKLTETRSVTNMKNQLITEIETAMLPFLDNAQLKQLHYALNHALWNKTITESESATFVRMIF